MKTKLLLPLLLVFFSINSYSQCDAIFDFILTGGCPGDEMTTVNNTVLFCEDAYTLEYTWEINDMLGNQLIPDVIGSVPAGTMIPPLTIEAGTVFESFELCLVVQVLNFDLELLEQFETCQYVSMVPQIDEDSFTFTCDGHCFSVNYNNGFYYNYTINGEPWNQFNYTSYCLEEGVYELVAVDMNGCMSSINFEVQGELSETNDNCSNALPLVNGVLVSDEICSSEDNAMECADFVEVADDWFVINSENYLYMNVGVVPIADSIGTYGFQVWEEQIPGDCQSLELFYCSSITEIPGCEDATSELTLNPQTNYYIQFFAYTGQGYELAVLLSNDASTLCGCTDAGNCNYNPEALINDWSCGYEGCTDPSACNFLQYASCDDGSCTYGSSLVAQLFHDLNGDGFWQTGFFGEPSLGNTGTIYVQELGVTLYPDNNGNFIFPELPLSTYTIEYTDNSNVWTLSTGDIFTLTLPTCNGAEIGLIPTSNTLVQISGPCCIWMMDIHCQNGMNPGLWVQNTGTVPLNGTFTMTFDPLLVPDYLAGAEPYDSYENGVLVWHIVNQMPGESVLYQCHINGPGVDYVGQVFPFDMVLELFDDEGNMVLTDNWLLDPTVVCAYDPNDKYAVPAGYTEEHFVLAEDEIEYRIRFQNTGNAPAELVIIEDQLDLSRLDLDTFYPVFASHNFNTIVQDDGLVKFVFNNIMLPASSVDEPGSQGYVVYRIKSFESLQQGEVINNTAAIYFDQNPPIITNTTWHTIFDCSSLIGLPEENHACDEGNYTGPQMQQNYVEEYLWTLDSEPLPVGNVSQLQIELNEGEHLIGLTLSNPLCNVSSEMNLTIHEYPENELIVNGNVLTASEGVTYVWYMNEEVIDGANSQEFIAQETGVYYVMVTNEWGCTTMSFAQDITVGLNEIDAPGFNFYPNPTSQNITLELQPGIWSLKVINSLSQIVFAEDNLQGKLTRDISQLSKGVYVVEVSNNQFTSNRKLVIE